jgi:hypothetical protein
LLPELSPTFPCTCVGSYMSSNDPTMHHLPIACSYGCVGAFRCTWRHLTAGNESSRQTRQWVTLNLHTRAPSVVPMDTLDHCFIWWFCCLRVWYTDCM